MTVKLPRLRFAGCEYLGPLGTGGLYVTDAELSHGWGLYITLRYLLGDGTPVPEPVYGPDRPPLDPFVMVQLLVRAEGHAVRPVMAGTAGSLMPSIGLHRFRVDDIHPLPTLLRLEVEQAEGLDPPGGTWIPGETVRLELT